MRSQFRLVNGILTEVLQNKYGELSYAPIRLDHYKIEELPSVLDQLRWAVDQPDLRRGQTDDLFTNGPNHWGVL
jgi:hypothetical protein